MVDKRKRRRVAGKVTNLIKKFLGGTFS